MKLKPGLLIDGEYDEEEVFGYSYQIVELGSRWDEVVHLVFNDESRKLAERIVELLRDSE
jgi:hypothetical protein